MTEKKRKVIIPYGPEGDPYLEGVVLKETETEIIIRDEMYGICRVTKPVEIKEVEE